MTTATTGLAMVCLVWAGMVASISFLEAPVKFRAPSLTRAVGLDVGRQVFGALGRAEVGWALLSAALAVLAGNGTAWRWGALAVVWGLVGAQRLWLWPVLRRRAGQIIAGENAPVTYHHVAYIGSEVAKVLLLVALSAALLPGFQAMPR